MTITTKAGYEAAPKTRLQVRCSQMWANNSGIMKWDALSTQMIPATAIVTTPTAFGSGGSLWSNGSTGFFPYPATASHVSGFRLGVSASVGLTGHSPVMLFDMIWGASGFAGNTTSAQNVASFPVLTRPDANGTGLHIYVAIKTAVGGAVTSECTVSYTNTAGTSGRTATLAYGTTAGWQAANNVFPLRLQAGDLGVKSIESLTFSNAQGTAGDIWLLLARPLMHASAELYGQSLIDCDLFKAGFQPIGDSAALTAMGLPGGHTGAALAELELAHG